MCVGLCNKKKILPLQDLYNYLKHSVFLNFCINYKTNSLLFQLCDKITFTFLVDNALLSSLSLKSSFPCDMIPLITTVTPLFVRQYSEGRGLDGTQYANGR